jgi:dTDP-4-amino-4,6-dideoxygalactose transaminase
MKITDRMPDFQWPVFDESDVEAVTAIVRSGKWGDPDCSDTIEAFETEFAASCGAKYAIACMNGSVAIRLALMACGVRPGDEVIVPSYTFITTASSVLEVNCVPVFADIDPDTYNMDPVAVEALITPRTRAIIPVHFAGHAADMEAIMAIAEKYNLHVIEDTAHGHGAEYKGKKLGTIGNVGTFSFQSSKNLTAGEGGMIITNDEALYRVMHSLRNVGRLPEGQWYDHFYPGCNYRITQMQAVLLSAQLKRLEEQTRIRNENGRYLKELLDPIPGIEPLVVDPTATLHSFHIFIFKYNPESFNGLSKALLVRELNDRGIPAFGGYPYPLYKQPLFQDKNFMCYAIPEDVSYREVCCPVAESACKNAVWLPQSVFLTNQSTMEKIALHINSIRTSRMQPNE